MTETRTDEARARRRGVALAAAGLVFGAVAAWLLPASWVFAPADRDADAGAEHETGAQYACPMFCVVMDHVPTEGTCPVCGMEMTLVSSDATLDRHEQRMIGLEAGTVRRVPLVKTLRVVGEVDYDETRLARISTRVEGWLETVWIESTWTEVAQGEPLAAIYSPELYQAEKEYVVAHKGSPAGSSELLRAARRRLELLDVDDREIDELERSGTPRDSVVLRSPISGVVVDRRAVEGASVGKGASLYTVADLSTVWVQALVFESDLPWIRVGQTVRLRADEATEPIAGTVAFVDPVIDRRSRTARLRVEVDNAPGADGTRRLRVGQRVDAWIEARLDRDGVVVEPGREDATPPLAIARSAVLSTGERHLVYALFAERETDDGRVRDYQLDPTRLPDKLWYEPVQVRLGPLARREGSVELAEYYPVLGVVPPPPRIDEATGEPVEVLSLRRLREGITVVESGNLLLDSQAQLAGRPSLLFPDGNRGAGTTTGDPHAGH